MTGRLHVVATPIGNLKDMSDRAREVLQAVDFVACEDTRRTGKLFELLGLERPEFVRVDAHTEVDRCEQLINRLLAGQNCALVSDAGTPIVSDPGTALVRGAARAGVEVVAVPGPSAALAALVVSGLATDRFAFDGFLPRKGRDRATALAALARRNCTTVVFESPKRTASTLVDLVGECGADRQAAVCRELTKMHETVTRGSLGELAASTDADLKGEVVIVVAGAPVADESTDDDIAAALKARKALGLDRKSAVAVVTDDLAIGRGRVYDLALDLDW